MGFSPEGSARALVLETIGSARHSIQMLAYAFQAPDIMQALVAAKQRGVEVRVVVDKQRNLGRASRQAMVVDGNAVQTGSFNYAASAETLNSENVLVMHDMPAVTAQYAAHWQSRWELGQPHGTAP